MSAWTLGGKVVLSSDGKVCIDTICPCDGGGGGSEVEVDCCPNPLPTTLVATENGISDASCAAFSGMSWNLTWNPSLPNPWPFHTGADGGWEGTVAGIPFRLFCEDNTNQFIFYLNAETGFGRTPQALVACDPLEIFDCPMTGTGSPCPSMGTLRVDITEP